MILNWLRHMRVKWLPQAKKQLRNTAKYIQKTFGDSTKDCFLNEVREASKLIGRNPSIGPSEPLLEGRAIVYRSLVVNQFNKIVYHVTVDYVEVSAFWDTRREPKKLTERVI